MIKKIERKDEGFGMSKTIITGDIFGAELRCEFTSSNGNNSSCEFTLELGEGSQVEPGKITMSGPIERADFKKFLRELIRELELQEKSEVL